MVRVKAAVSLFCESTSIRGMGKIVRSKTRFLRLLWLVFVIMMTAVLLSCVTLLIFDFLNYDVSVQTQSLTQADSPFPAITVCHHHPFSKRAYELWEAEKVKSPTVFNWNLRQRAFEAMKDERVEDMENAFYYDSMSIYYQNIPYKYVFDLGHDYNAFLYCISKVGAITNFENNCSHLADYNMRRFSHNQYFNCYTFEPANNYSSQDTIFLGLIVSLDSKPPNYLDHEQGLFMDIFDQARGLRVVVHQPGILPNLEMSGIHVEPGKLNEISYQPVHWNKLNTPKRECMENVTVNTITDLNQTYAYSYSQCQNQELQRLLMAKCNCILSLYPRLHVPDDALPYCASFLPNFTEFNKRVACVSEFLYRPPQFKSKCQQLCTYYDYEATVSITKWRAHSWQLQWVVMQQQTLEALKQLKRANQSIVNTTHYLLYEDFFKKSNLRNITSNDSNTRKLDLKGDNFTYIVLTKKTKDVIQKTERLVLSLNVLLSRIGGLCSLSIGLTAAFVVEIIEFFYVYYSNLHEKNSNKFENPSPSETVKDSIKLVTTTTAGQDCLVIKQNGGLELSKELPEAPSPSPRSVSDGRVSEDSENMSPFVLESKPFIAIQEITTI